MLLRHPCLAGFKTVTHKLYTNFIEPGGIPVETVVCLKSLQHNNKQQEIPSQLLISLISFNQYLNLSFWFSF